MATYTCPKGHSSATGDYCDTCGALIDPPRRRRRRGPGRRPSRPPRAAVAPRPRTACPGCGEPVTGRFCESCGYDVESGTPPASVAVTLHLSADRSHWERMVGEGARFPDVVPSLTFELTGERAVLGRVRPGAAPEVDLALTGAAADAVSQRQCVFERRRGLGRPRRRQRQRHVDQRRRPAARRSSATACGRRPHPHGGLDLPDRSTRRPGRARRRRAGGLAAGPPRVLVSPRCNR